MKDTLLGFFIVAAILNFFGILYLYSHRNVYPSYSGAPSAYVLPGEYPSGVPAWFSGGQ